MYHPAQDINHCVYRLLLILECSEHERFNIDVYRLIDFYVLFPNFLKRISPLPKNISKYRDSFKNIKDPFESLKNERRIVHELERLQSIAIKNLLAKNILDKKSFDDGVLLRTDDLLPEIFMKKMSSARIPNEDWFKVLVNEFPKANFLGRNGLKSRTGLMEYRYDMESL